MNVLPVSQWAPIPERVGSVAGGSSAFAVPASCSGIVALLVGERLELFGVDPGLVIVSLSLVVGRPVLSSTTESASPAGAVSLPSMLGDQRL